MPTTARTIALTALVAASLAACAQAPDAIAPVSMGAAYATLPCAAAAAERASVATQMQGLVAAQNGAVMGDAIGVILIGVPTSSLTGGNKAGEIGAAKGKLLALDARLAACRGGA